MCAGLAFRSLVENATLVGDLGAEYLPSTVCSDFYYYHFFLFSQYLVLFLFDLREKWDEEGMRQLMKTALFWWHCISFRQWPDAKCLEFSVWTPYSYWREREQSWLSWCVNPRVFTWSVLFRKCLTLIAISSPLNMHLCRISLLCPSWYWVGVEHPLWPSATVKGSTYLDS